jgi:hypothetical protein
MLIFTNISQEREWANQRGTPASAFSYDEELDILERALLQDC